MFLLSKQKYKTGKIGKVKHESKWAAILRKKNDSSSCNENLVSKVLK